MTVQPESVLAVAAENNTIVFSTSTGSLTSTTTLTNASFGASTFTAKDGTAVLEIEYLDSLGLEQEEVITLNGTTLVLTTFTDGIFVNDFYALLVSGGGTSDGNITIRKAGGSGTDTYNILGAGQNKSVVPKRMIPKGKTLILKGWSHSEVQDKRVIYRIRATCSHGVKRRLVYHFIANGYDKKFGSGEMTLNEEIPELSIMTISGWADQSAAEGACSWWGELKDNS